MRRPKAFFADVMGRRLNCSVLSGRRHCPFFLGDRALGRRRFFVPGSFHDYAIKTCFRYTFVSRCATDRYRSLSRRHLHFELKLLSMEWMPLTSGRGKVSGNTYTDERRGGQGGISRSSRS